MNLARKGELALVEQIRARFSSRLPGGGTGIGDDAAVIPLPRGGRRKLLASVDAMVEGVHFDLSFITPEQLGYKLVVVNVSDIYAMGGRPTHLLLSLALPSSTKFRFIDSFFDGIELGLREHKASLAGGDLSSSPSGISLSATVMGHAENPVMRKGACVGDGVFVSGTLGDSALGLSLLKRIGRPVDTKKGRQRPLPWRVMGPLIGRHLMPAVRPLTATALKHVSAMMDLSDGLLLDLWRLIEANGLGAIIHEDAIPVSREARDAAAYLGADPLESALGGGEDYRLLFTSPCERVRSAHRIGTITPGGLGMKMLNGRTRRLRPVGYGHFSRAKGR